MNILKLDINNLASDFKSSSEIEHSSEDFLRRLKIAVTQLLATNSVDSLMQVFYRLDLPEHQTNLAMQSTSQSDKVDQITRLIFDRIKKKLITRAMGV